MIKRILRTLTILAVLSTNVACDRITKNMVREQIEYNEELHFVNNHLTLTKIENTGAFLSLGHALPKILKVILLTFLPLIVLGLASYYLLSRRNLSDFTAVGICFIIGGGAGNLYDRIVYGSVTDFLHIDFEIFRTGIFNMADVSIMTGICIVVFETYINRARLNPEKIETRGDQ
jgi:signal peptidase II